MLANPHTLNDARYVQDEINRLIENLSSRRDAIEKLRPNLIIEGQPDLMDIEALVRDLISWLKWLSRKDPSEYYRHFNVPELQQINGSIAPAADTLAEIQNDKVNKNTAGRIYTQHPSIKIDLLNYYGAMLPIGRARSFSTVSRREAREAADQAIEAKEETEKLAQLKAIGTLAEYFQELVVEEDENGNVKHKQGNWWKNQGYEYKARRWFVATSLAGVAAVGYALLVVLWLNNIEANDPSDLIYAKLVTKILAIIPVLYLVRIFQRNYNAFMHLAAVNRHKAQALKTLKAYLSDSSIGPEARIEILKEANRHVFDTNQTGFISRKDGAGSSESGLRIGPVSV